MKIRLKVNQAGTMLYSPLDLVVQCQHSVDRALDESFRLGIPHLSDVFAGCEAIEGLEAEGVVVVLP
mgnify:CR=1 FL=1